jgi:hypothetical protein
VKVPQENLDMLGQLIEPWFIFALIWSVGATCDGDSRHKFSQFLREKMKEENVCQEIIFCFQPQTTLSRCSIRVGLLLI